LTDFWDLSRDDQAKVIGGMVLVLTAFGGFVAFLQFRNARDFSALFASEPSIFRASMAIIPWIYVFSVLPASILGIVTAGIYAKRSFTQVLKATGLALFIGAGCVLMISASLLLFGVLFSDLPQYIQAPLIIPAIFIPGIIASHITKKADKYFRNL
jgi:hypothetical protein